MNCGRCSQEVERVWTGKKTVMVEPRRVVVYVPMNGDDVFMKSSNGRIAHKCPAAAPAGQPTGGGLGITDEPAEGAAAP